MFPLYLRETTVTVSVSNNKVKNINDQKLEITLIFLKSGKTTYSQL